MQGQHRIRAQQNMHFHMPLGGRVATFPDDWWVRYGLLAQVDSFCEGTAQLGERLKDVMRQRDDVGM